MTTILFCNKREVLYTAVPLSEARLEEKDYVVGGTTALYVALVSSIDEKSKLCSKANGCEKSYSW